MANPVEQFAITPVFGGATHEGAHVALPFYTFTNSSVAMLVTVVLATLLFWAATRKSEVVPGRWQSLGEVLFEFVAGLIKDNVGKEGMRYFPFIFTLFIFVFFGNMIGLVPWSFTFTSHILVTAALAVVIFVTVTIIGFARHGLHYFRMFFPHGAPIATAPIMVPVEIVSYLSRPLSLSVRLFANMTVGHIILAVLGGFVVSLKFFGFVPLAAIGGMYLLEVLVCALQAYVFTVLTCIYLNDAINMH